MRAHDSATRHPQIVSTDPCIKRRPCAAVDHTAAAVCVMATAWQTRPNSPTEERGEEVATSRTGLMTLVAAVAAAGSIASDTGVRIVVPLAILALAVMWVWTRTHQLGLTGAH